MQLETVEGAIPRGFFAAVYKATADGYTHDAGLGSLLFPYCRPSPASEGPRAYPPAEAGPGNPLSKTRPETLGSRVRNSASVKCVRSLGSGYKDCKGPSARRDKSCRPPLTGLAAMDLPGNSETRAKATPRGTERRKGPTVFAAAKQNPVKSQP